MKAPALALARLALAGGVVAAIVVAPPDLARLFGSFALRHDPAALSHVGWLAAALTNALYASPLHTGALAGASVASALLAMAAVEARARRSLSPAWALGVTALATLSFVDALRIGGGSATLAFAAVALWLLESSITASVLAFAALAALWCNVGATGLLAPFFALVAAAAVTQAGRDDGSARAAWLRAALATLASLATPLGFAFPGRAFADLQLAGASAAYAPWAPPDVAPHAYRIGVVAVVALALALGIGGRGAREAWLAVAAFVVALANGALVGIFALVAAPQIRPRWQSAAPATASTAGALVTCAAIVVGAGIAAAASGSRDLPLARTPYGGIERLARERGAHRVACGVLAWCDAARSLGLDVVADGRIAEAQPAVHEAQIALFGGRAPQTLDRLAVDVAIAGRTSALATLLLERGWTPYATYPSAIVLVRPPHA
ncbi:MAG: hypothetical protein NVSMB21_05890 [Vulcanimicrobiaceae bacterium]